MMIYTGACGLQFVGLLTVLSALSSYGTDAFSTPSHQGGALPPLPNVKAAVIVPGFLTGKDEFIPLAQSLTNCGIPTVVVPMPNWHWLPCLGGRSMRPMLERIDFTVKHLAAVAGDLDQFDSLTKDTPLSKDPQLLIPNSPTIQSTCIKTFETIQEEHCK